MPTTIADRLAASRRRRFVGRDVELARFSELLDTPQLPVTVLAVHGPAGVGKSTLLRRFGELATQRQLPVLAVDARDLGGGPDGLRAAFAPLLSGAEGRPIGRQLAVIDTYELLAELDAWIRDDLLPRLPADTLVVLAGRHPPGPGWRADPGWSELLESIGLRNLSPRDSLQYLDVVGVPAERQQGCVDFTHGYPLALALAGELARQDDPVEPRDSPDLIRDLLHRLLDGLPGGQHRAALEACAQVRVLTEALLAQLLDAAAPAARAEANDLFDWLRSLPIVESGPSGALLHDLAREALDADLGWRDPVRRAQLHLRARQHYLAQLPVTPPAEQQRLLLDLMYLHAGLRLFFAGADTDGSGLWLAAFSPDDAAAVLALVQRHEGAQSAAIAGHWMSRMPNAWQLVRDRAGQVAGVLLMLPLEDLGPDDADSDPAVAAALTELARRTPLRSGERATHLRFWLSGDGYQTVGPAQSLMAAAWAVHYLTTPGLAITLTPFADPDYWAPFCAYADQVRMPAADFEVGGRRYGVYGHDWRSVPPAAWVSMLADREMTEPAPDGPAHPAPPDVALLVLSREEFASSAKAALRDLHRPDRLARNPLLRSRLVAARSAGESPAERVAALRELVTEAAGVLEHSPRNAREYRAINRTFLRPAGSQEKAAEVLGLPSSTFRRHLTAGVAAIVDLLWDGELGAGITAG